ncbi:MAG: hypothetical protein LHV69_03360 [Elusimicrobia bacterium]|nr:hypothetical protein [Candidatus Obscuribacterium magneticum]
MNRKSRGNTTVEFLFAFLLLIILCLGVLDLSLLSLEQFRLERFCQKTARDLTLSSLFDEEQMRRAVDEKLRAAELAGVTYQLLIRPLPTLSGSSPLRSVKSVFVVELEMRRQGRLRFLKNPVVLGARSWEAGFWDQ